MLRRSAVEEVGRHSRSIQVVPDYYLYVALARRYQARAVQEVVCRYRVHSRQHVAVTNRQRLHEEPLLIIEQWAESP